MFFNSYSDIFFYIFMGIFKLQKIKYHNSIILFLFTLCVSIVFNCSTKIVERNTTVYIDGLDNTEFSELAPVTDYYGDVMTQYKKGIKEAGNRNWNNAQTHLENALDIIAQIKYTDENIKNEVEILKYKIVSAYKDVLPQVAFLKENATMEIVEEKLENDLETIYKDTTLDTVETIVIKDTLMYDIPLIVNTRVKNCIKFFTTAGKEPFRLWIKNKGKYEDMILKKLKKAELPENLLYLAMIESGFNPKAYSRSHAAGLWQFIVSTGKNYGLRSNYWIDERYDPEKSTDAAIKYLKKLYNMFGDWHLAMASYNSGENGIIRALNKSKFMNYWALNERNIKKETINYVPKIIAATIICSNIKKYGFDPTELHDPIKYDTIIVNGCISLETVAKCAETNVATIKELNPSILRWCTPPNVKKFSVNVPDYKVNTARYNYNRLPKSAFIKWNYYTVKKGDNISSIAKRYNISAKTIMDMNSLNGTALSVGKKLIMPHKIKHKVHRKKTIKIKSNKTKEKYYDKINKNKNKFIYKIQAGDKLINIANQYGVSIEDLCRWNNIESKSSIHTGDIIIIYKEHPSRHIKNKEALSPIKHIVKKGQTLWSISRMYNTDVNQILSFNKIKALTTLKVGKILLIPTHKKKIRKEKKQPQKILYRVKTGDTITKIAKKYKVTTKNILKWNNIKPNSVIKQGQLITIWTR